MAVTITDYDTEEVLEVSEPSPAPTPSPVTVDEPDDHEPPPVPRKNISTDPSVYSVPVGAKPVERDAAGNVTVYRDAQGVRHYGTTSTMYKMGFHNSKEYQQAQTIGAPWGPHSGRLVPEGSIAYFEGGNIKGKFPPQVAAQRDLDPDSAKTVIKGKGGRDVYLSNEDITAYNKETEPEAKLKLAKELNLVGLSTTLKQFTGDPVDVQKKASAAAFVQQQGTKRQREAESKLAKYKVGDGYDLVKAVSDGLGSHLLRTAGFKNKDINEAADISHSLDNIKGYKVDGGYNTADAVRDGWTADLITAGFTAEDIKEAREINAYNAEVAKYNALLKGDLPKDASAGSIIKSVWRALTPWDEDAGQTYLEYMKGYPERLKETLLATTRKDGPLGQDKLKERYQQQKEADKNPLWSRILFAPEYPVVYDKRTDLYLPVIGGEAPLVGGKGKAAQEAVKVATKTAKEAGMTTKQFNRFVKWRAANPNLPDESFKISESMNKAAPKADWDGIIKKLQEAVNKQQIKSKPELVSWIEKNVGTKEVNAPLSKFPTLREKLVRELERQGRMRDASIQKALQKIEKEGIKLTEQQKRIISAQEAFRQQTGLTQRVAPKGAPSPIPAGKIVFMPSVKATPKSLIQLKLAFGAKNQTVQQLEALQKRISELKPSQQTKLKTLTDQQTKLLNKLSTETDTRVMAATILSNALQEATQTKTEGLTETQLKSQIENLVEQQLKQLTATQTRQQVKQISRLQAKTEIVTPIKTITPTMPVMPTKPTIPTKPVTPTTPIIPTLKLPSSRSQRQARRIIKQSNGAIAWRMGQVAGKDRWDVIVNPYTKDEHYYMVLGSPPKGATIVRKGKGSAKGTAQMIRGKPPSRQVTVDSGFQDISITPGGGKKITLDFKADPEGETRGDITIGKRHDRIGERLPRISGRTPRISSRVPRIS